MAEKKSDIKEGEVLGPPIVQSTTEAMPSPADETSVPNAINTETEQPPVRSAMAGEKLAQTLAAGAGEHTPPDSELFDEQGRVRPGKAPAAEADSSADAKGKK